MTIVVREPKTTLVVRDPQMLVVTEPAERVVVRETVHDVVVVREPDDRLLLIDGVGPRGIPGTNRLFIQPDQPLDAPGTYMWLQTGLGADGSEFTLWFEDGQP